MGSISSVIPTQEQVEGSKAYELRLGINAKPTKPVNEQSDPENVNTKHSCCSCNKLSSTHKGYLSLESATQTDLIIYRSHPILYNTI